GRDERGVGEPDPDAVDLACLLEELESPRGTAHSASDIVEVDLSIVLDDIGRQAAPALAAQDPEQGSPSLDGVFENLREEVAEQSEQPAAERLYAHALALRESGDLDGCVQALQAASRGPALRFKAALLLGRLCRERGTLSQAVDWFERAAQAPA